MIEVEVKLALTDSKRVEQKLRKDGFVLQKIVRETDTYFNGIDRDFAKQMKHCGCVKQRR